MATRLFPLNNVPDDEAEDVRGLLTNHAIDFYETPEGNWGISVPALWLRDEAQFDKARALIDEYQHERMNRAREEYEREKREGKVRTVRDVIKENPLRFAVYSVVIALVIYFSTKPFLNFGN